MCCAVVVVDDDDGDDDVVVVVVLVVLVVEYRSQYVGSTKSIHYHTLMLAIARMKRALLHAHCIAGHL